MGDEDGHGVARMKRCEHYEESNDILCSASQTLRADTPGLYASAVVAEHLFCTKTGRPWRPRYPSAESLSTQVYATSRRTNKCIRHASYSTPAISSALGAGKNRIVAYIM